MSLSNSGVHCSTNVHTDKHTDRQTDRQTDSKTEYVENSRRQIKTMANKNLEEKDGQRQLLWYVSLIRACNKVLYQLVYIGKKFVFLKKNLGI